MLVRFVSFSTLVDWTVNLTSDVIAPPSFGEEEHPAATEIIGQQGNMKTTPKIDANAASFATVDDYFALMHAGGSINTYAQKSHEPKKEMSLVA